ncbi:hypothetical protein [Halomonas sp. HAL1]|uniref:hypothetical protein n=1 Tax=Halomonas sp. HAL1 TaxID=550984 RepID=UPI00022D2902|nr:hypothetical protein [Halomonas sp. HAL1]EHA15526.1 hypothetical protein HAL1_11292 [Halomonas sp. HAL1]WKV92045.1 hypothetical protein Q3Y66_14405 [Halomonas sp. HAL1]
MSKKDNLNFYLKKRNYKGSSSNAEKFNYNDFFSTTAQVGTLLVVVFGYFYTVRPVFQHQLLEEKNAQVELDKVRLEADLKRIETDLADRRFELNEVALRNEKLEENIASYESEINGLLATRNELEEEAREAYLSLQEERERSDVLLKEVEIAELREREASDRIEAIQQQVQTELDALELARWELVLTDIQQIGIVELVGSLSTFGSISDFTVTEYLSDVSENWPNLYLSILNTIDEMEDRNANGDRYPPEYLNELRSLATVNIENLRCERPDFNEIESRYYRDLVGSEKRAIAEANEQMESLKSDYAENGKEVVFSDDYFDRSYKVALVMEEHDLNRKYRSIVDSELRECSSKRFDFYENVAEIKGLNMSF